MHCRHCYSSPCCCPCTCGVRTCPTCRGSGVVPAPVYPFVPWRPWPIQPRPRPFLMARGNPVGDLALARS